MLWLLAVVGLASGGSVRLSVLAPGSDHVQALPVILPIINLAVRNVSDPRTGLLPGWNISLVFRNTGCSSTHGPLAAFELYKQTDAFLGPVCDYVIAPVCRYCGVWGRPVITAGAQADHFFHKTPEYPTLTRVMGSYRSVSHAMRQILAHFDWKVAGMLYFNYGVSSVKGTSKCHRMLGPVFTALGASSVHKSFTEEANTTEFRRLLLYISKSARKTGMAGDALSANRESISSKRVWSMSTSMSDEPVYRPVVVVCADPPVVREILLVAEELNMIDSGEYVFFNIELFNNQYNMHNPWYVEGDTEERNTRAKKAFTALLTVTARTPESRAYRNFSDEIKRMAKEKYNYTFGPDPVSTFVTAFYDAVLLYAIALNETLSSGGNQSNGWEITRRMWNRTFMGITGMVDIDSNGDRVTDYSLLDMDPETNEFRIVAHYIGLREELEYVEKARIHWSGGRDSPPPDTPVCGFDNSLCKSMPIYAVLSIVMSCVVVVLVVFSLAVYRSVRLQTEWSRFCDRLVYARGPCLSPQPPLRQARLI